MKRRLRMSDHDDPRDMPMCKHKPRDGPLRLPPAIRTNVFAALCVAPLTLQTLSDYPRYTPSSSL
jgi:hypothetical protein